VPLRCSNIAEGSLAMYTKDTTDPDWKRDSSAMSSSPRSSADHAARVEESSSASAQEASDSAPGQAVRNKISSPGQTVRNTMQKRNVADGDGVGHGDSDKKLRRRRFRRKCIKMTQDAAQRCLNGNGCTPNLPELPLQFQDGLCHPHPYGVRTYGNIYSSEGHGDRVRRQGLGAQMAILNDEQLIMLLECLDPVSLAQMSACSRFCYVAIHAETSLWRDAALRHYDDNKLTIASFTSGTWKDQYIWSQQQHREKEAVNPLYDNKESSRLYHKPLVIAGVYSDTLYRSFLCRSFDLTEDKEKGWSVVDNIARERASDFSTKQFLQKYEEPNVPVIVEDATKDWPAIQKWSSIEYLQSVTTQKPREGPSPDVLSQNVPCAFRATSGTASVPANFTMQAYQEYCMSAAAKYDESPLYLFDRTFATKAPQLSADYRTYLPPYFSPDAPHGHDLFGLLDKRREGNSDDSSATNEVEVQQRRPDFRWMICGPQRSGSAFHIDPNATHAWNAPVVGRKRWILYPPSAMDHPPPGVHPSQDGDTVTMPLSIGEWMVSFWSQHVKRRSHPDVNQRPIECTVSPGDLIFVPHGWWHTVLNIDPGMSLALTQNYVSASNVSNVLRFLETRPGQISGCRDRAGDAIPPEDLLKEMTKSLQHHRSDLYEPAILQAKEPFTCPAWIDDVDSNVASGGEDKKDSERMPSLWERAKMPTNLRSGVSASETLTATIDLDKEKEEVVDSNVAGQGFSFSFI
jgi:hypothetical protein